jgi:DNA-binding LytR/AlgR family response regulator
VSGNPGLPRLIIADDERLMREQLRLRVSQAWPDAQIEAEARNGEELVELVRGLRPDAVFLDIRMPGLNGVEAAREILQLDYGDEGLPPELVFITAYDQYAVQAFEHGAVDYVLKPAQPARLERTVERLRQRLAARRSGDDLAAHPAALQRLLNTLSAQVSGRKAARLEVIQASSGSTIQMISVQDVLFFISDEKYTRVQTASSQALIRKPIKELVAELDPERFWQIHRSTIINVGAVKSVTRDERGRQVISLHGHPQKLEVSRSFAGVFRAM